MELLPLCPVFLNVRNVWKYDGTASLGMKLLARFVLNLLEFPLGEFQV